MIISKTGPDTVRWPIRIVTVFVVLLAVSCNNGTSPIATVPDLVISGATLIDGTGGKPISNAVIAIKGGKIIEIADSSTYEPPADVTIIDAEDAYVIPGLADMHVHLGSGGFEPRDAQTVDRVMRQFLYYGVTTILNLGATRGSTDDIVELRKRIQTGDLLTPHLRATGHIMTVPGSHPVATIMRVPEGADPTTYDWRKSGIAVIESVEEARETVIDSATKGMDAIKITVESGPSEFGEHPRMSLEMIKAIVEEAKAHGLPVVAHISSLDELEDCIKGGVHAIVHAVSEPPYPNEKHWALMREKDIYYVPTLTLYATLFGTRLASEVDFADPFLLEGVSQVVIESVKDFLPPPIGPSSQEELLNDWKMLLSSLREAHEAGVKIALGTDVNNPKIFPGFSVHMEMELLFEAGFTPMEILEISTRMPAMLLGEDDVGGTLQVGKRADLLILEANPLEEIRNTRTIRTVIANGKVVPRVPPNEATALNIR